MWRQIRPLPLVTPARDRQPSLCVQRLRPRIGAKEAVAALSPARLVLAQVTVFAGTRWSIMGFHGEQWNWMACEPLAQGIRPLRTAA
jgi:hypothetical protein